MQRKELPTGRHTGNEKQRQRVRPEGGKRKENARNGERETERGPKLISAYLPIGIYMYRHTHTQIKIHMCACVFNPSTHQKTLSIT